MKTWLELTNKLNGKSVDEKLKLIWGWTKEGTINLKTFRELIRNDVSADIEKYHEKQRQLDEPA